jgi:glycine oxidase
MATADVTVMGGGIFGLATAYALGLRGAKVRLIERHHVGAGSSGGLVGALAPHVPENWNPKKAFQLESLLMAGEFWSGVQARSDIDPGYLRSGRLRPLVDERAVDQARRRIESARLHWQGRAEWSVGPAPDADWAGTSPTGLFAFDGLTARLHPRQAAKALAGAIRALGGMVEELNEPVDGDGRRMPPAGIFESRKWDGPVIWATGLAGLRDISDDLGRAIGGGVKGQAALFACEARDMPQLFVDGLHIVPHLDGTVAIGSTSEQVWSDPAATDGQLDALIEKARVACPMLRSAPVIERWAGVRPRAASRAPMLGRWPDREGHFIANGGFKIGFGMAPKVAEVMADLVLEGRDTIPAGFRVEDCL